MRLGLLSDIHANLHALEACLEHAQRHEVQCLAFLGDMVGYGAEPAAVLDRIRQLQAEGASVIKGNHDAMAVCPPAYVSAIGDVSAQWTHQQLDAEQRQWLDGLPMTLQLDSTLLVHASLDAPAQWHYVYEARAAGASLDAAAQWPGARYVFGGHVHLQTLYCRGLSPGLLMSTPRAGMALDVPAQFQWLATVGSVGQPRDGKTAAMYAIFDSERAQLTFHRVDYNYIAAARAIRRAGLPDFFADRLEVGR